MTDRDSPIEWTGRVHIVTVTCDECGEGFSLSEGAAADTDTHVCIDCKNGK